ncbi:MAG: hypothetical protein D3913_14915, partial [Candidatus Electrothrix sp. LOE1_4_5]|nr:hypothetical protein [Candidatus Electrothrix gigas]
MVRFELCLYMVLPTISLHSSRLKCILPLTCMVWEKKWIKVSDYENDKGWIYASLVSQTPYVIVRVDEGNVRSGPG